MTRTRQLFAATAAVAVAAGLRAQTRVDPDELVHLEPVLHAAMVRAAPFTVTIETFGGTRKVLGPDPGGEGGAKPRSMPPVPPGEQPLADPGFHQAQGRSTGIVIDPDGWILVSRFALNYDPTTILVTVPGGGTHHAVRKGEDTSRGIALVKIDAHDLRAATFVDPARAHVGQWAFVLGRTFGDDEPTVHIGIVSALRRQFGRALQIDAYTSPANYGGPVIDVDGSVLGIAVPLSPAGRDAGVEWYDSGIGFCSTIADIPKIVERMKAGEVLHRGWLGVVPDPAHLGPGAKLVQVPKEGVAATAGLRMGDIVTAIDGIAVKNGPHLQMLVSSRMGGDSVGLEVLKKQNGEKIAMTLLLADLPSAERAESKEGELPASFPLPEKKQGR
jgi:serine protease Do